MENSSAHEGVHVVHFTCHLLGEFYLPALMYHFVLNHNFVRAISSNFHQCGPQKPIPMKVIGWILIYHSQMANLLHEKLKYLVCHLF